jgi:hypothetical protein
LGCVFFRHCWNEGLKLPTLKNCSECSDRYFEYRQETANRDPSMIELEGYIPVTIGVKKLRSLITPRRGKLI